VAARDGFCEHVLAPALVGDREVRAAADVEGSAARLDRGERGLQQRYVCVVRGLVLVIPGVAL